MLPIHFRGGVHPSEAGSSLNTEKLRLSPCLRATNCCHLHVTELTTRRHIPKVMRSIAPPLCCTPPSHLRRVIISTAGDFPPCHILLIPHPAPARITLSPTPGN